MSGRAATPTPEQTALRRAVTTAVTAAYGITVNDLIAARRASELVEARMMWVWLLRRIDPSLSYPTLGYWIGRHHTSVMALERRAIAERGGTNTQFQRLSSALIGRLTTPQQEAVPHGQ